MQFKFNVNKLLTGCEIKFRKNDFADPVYLKLEAIGQ